MLNKQREYIAHCWEDSKKHWGIAVALILISIYSVAGFIAPFIELPALAWTLPKIPLIWAVIMVLVGLVYILIEGGYRYSERIRGEMQGTINSLNAQINGSLPDFDISIEHVSCGAINASHDNGKTYREIAYIAPLVWVANRRAPAALHIFRFAVKLPDGTVYHGERAIHPDQLDISDRSGNTITIPFGDPLSESAMQPIVRGAPIRGRLFFTFPGLRVDQITGPGFEYLLRVKDVFFPETKEYSASAPWKIPDEKVQTFPGTGMKAVKVKGPIPISGGPTGDASPSASSLDNESGS